MFLGFHTGVLIHHDPLAAVDVLAEIGYEGVALAASQATLNPYSPDFRRQIDALREALQHYGMRSAVEANPKYLLDPWCADEPSLLSPHGEGRARRIEYLLRLIDAAAQLSSRCVSLWSGRQPPGCSPQEALDRLAASLEGVLEHAARRGVTVAVEPEPGMFIATIADFQRLLQWIDSPHLQLTLDVGNLYEQGEVPVADYIRRCHDRLVHVHLRDVEPEGANRAGGESGTMDFQPVIATLHSVGYQGGVYVQLNGNVSDVLQAARTALQRLWPLIHSP